jgi:hypothetical protein
MMAKATNLKAVLTAAAQTLRDAAYSADRTDDPEAGQLIARAEQVEEELAHLDACLLNAEPGEPLFVLRAQDRLAPGVVDEWALRLHHSSTATHDQMQRSHGKLVAARQVAEDMRAWQAANHGRAKLPD